MCLSAKTKKKTPRTMGDPVGIKNNEHEHNEYKGKQTSSAREVKYEGLICDQKNSQ